MVNSVDISKVKPSALPTRGFGLSPITMWDGQGYDETFDTIWDLLIGEESPSRRHIAKIRTMEHIFDLCLQRKRADWLTNYSLLGYPPTFDLRESKESLSNLRRHLSKRDNQAVIGSLDRVVKGNMFLPIWNYRNKSNWINNTRVSGWVYIIGQDQVDPNLVKIGMTRGLYRYRVQAFNRQTLVLYPYSVRMVFPVRNARAAEATVFEHLKDYRLRPDREFFSIPVEKAIEEVENTLDDARMLSRAQGVVQRATRVTGLGRGVVLSTKHGEVVVPQSELDFRYSTDLVGTDVEFDLTFSHSRLVGLRGRLIDDQLTLE